MNATGIISETEVHMLVCATLEKPQIYTDQQKFHHLHSFFVLLLKVLSKLKDVSSHF